VSERNRSLIALLVAAYVVAWWHVVAPTLLAQSACGSADESSPFRGFFSRVGPWDVRGIGARTCDGGARVMIESTLMRGGDLVPGGRIDRPLGPTRVIETPMYCRRDDYPFLPPNALGGLPCVAATPGEHIDPRAEALRLESEVAPPAVRIGMNPRLGMVAVPTWFWVEGYDGNEISRARTVVEAHQECRFAMVHDDQGLVVLAADGRPQLQRQCETRTTTFTIQVRLWPNRYAWDFGDQHHQEVRCATPSACLDGLGQTFVDSRHPSTIRHPYVWTSLGQIGINGDEDAYRISLEITFSAAFRVAVNGASPGGWQSLPDRELSWAASHQVQEAQAVLTRPR
jgi:hypothetical protein